MAAAVDGPIVVVSVSRFGSYGLILTQDGLLEPVPLDDLTPEVVQENVIEFLTALENPSGSAAAQPQLTAVLGWLWDAVAGPVLDQLGLSRTPPMSTPWPRLWWCIPGLLSFLPLHAAGHHETRFDALPETVMDRVVSSYTPTIRALLYARRAPSACNTYDDSKAARRDVVVVAMPYTPAASDLPGAEAEADMLRQRFRGRVLTLVGSEATHDSVIEVLPGASWAHFACHGFVDLANPSASYLLLNDHLRQPLTVMDVARLRLEDAELAFLSACSTADPGGRLIDEAIHLTSAFQLAGYRHVIGTLWPINDQVAVEIADNMAAAAASIGTVDTAAFALHAITRRLRDRWLQMPSVWASHIHSGA
jgi:hypothetical protein